MFRTRLHFRCTPFLSGKVASILICGATLALATDAADAQQRLVGQPVTAAASAVVSFKEAAQRDAAKPLPTGPVIPRLIPDSEPPPEPYFPPATDWSGQNLLSLANLPQPLVPSPSPSLNFAGLDDIPITGTSMIVIPPDTDGAVGLTKVMSGLNNNYRIFDKATGSVISTVSTDTFWSGIGATGPFDPKTLYDPFNDRWIAVMVSDAVAANSSILIGVSQTSDQSGAYLIFRVDVDSTNTDWADFPVVGFNKNWVSVNVNMINITTSNFDGGKNLVIDYPSLRTGTFSAVFFTGTGFVASPCATYSSSEPTLYVPTHLSSAGATYELDTITGTPSSPVYTLGATKTRTGGAWTQPTGQILPQAAPLSGTSACGATPCKVETQDAQIRSTPVFRDSFIYYAQTIGLPAGGLTHTAAQWTKVDASGNFVDGGRVDDPTATATNGGKWYAYPHIAVNSPGDILLGFSQFASNQYPTTGYTFHDRTDAAGTMRDPFLYKAGEDYYHKTFSGTRNRWGDYSKAQVDPFNDLDLWTVQEYAKARTGTDDGNTSSNSSKWGTWWAEVGVPSPVQLTGAVSRKNHAGTDFDINLPLSGEPGVECRSGGGVYRLVFTFNNNVVGGSASVTSGIGNVSGTPTFAGNTMTVDLSGVTNIQRITVRLSNVTDNSAQVLPTAAVAVNMLLGDVNGNRLVNSTDTSLVQAQSGKSLTPSNFRMDVNANGLINSTDTSIVQSKSGTGLPSSP